MRRRRFLESFVGIPLLMSPWKAAASSLHTETPIQRELYNGIRMNANWPPSDTILSPEPMPVPYLRNTPRVIKIDVGRQLFVDDFLIEETTLKRTYHQPDYFENNPIIKPDQRWELEGPAPFAGPFSGGIWYDHQDKLFKMWYTGGYIKYTCYATSRDGVHWEKPSLDVVPGTNIVIDHTKSLEGDERRALDTNCVWVDYGDDAAYRYKIFYTTGIKNDPDRADGWHLQYCHSNDGIHWSKPQTVSGHVGDHTNAHYNPFRNKWVINIRYEARGRGRARAYAEGDDPIQATSLANDIVPSGRIVPWLAADKYDPHNPDRDSAQIAPQLYQFDGIAYESVMLGFFSIWQGPNNRDCVKLHTPKRNEVVLGYSRDGFHFYRPDRRPFFYVTERPDAWNWGNCQSATGACIVAGDKLYLYFSARNFSKDKTKFWDGDINAGLAFLRRDGFASMDSEYEVGTLKTRPVQFSGKRLFVNANSRQGELRVELLDSSGTVIEPFTKDNCQPLMADKTLQMVTWRGGSDLSQQAGKPIRFKFHLRLGELYSFWVSPDDSGASHGYIGSGGPGHTGFIDVEGEKALAIRRK